MAITGTKISDLVPSEKILGNLINLELGETNALINSRVAATGSPEIDAVASGGPRIASIPFLNPLDTTEYNVSSDDITEDGSVGKLTADEYNAVRRDLNYGWGYADLTRMATQFSASAGIVSGLAQYWSTIYNKNAVLTINAAIDAAVDPENAGESLLTYNAGAVNFDHEVLIDGAAYNSEEYADQFDTVILNPAQLVMAKKINNGNAFVPADAQNRTLANFYGFNVIVSRDVEAGSAILCRPGALAFGEGTPAAMVAIEIERLANKGNGGGAEILHSRRSLVLHPQGFGYKGPVRPLEADIANPANWEAKVAVERIGFRKVTFTGAA